MPLVRFKPKPAYVPNIASKPSLEEFNRDLKPGKPQNFPTPSITPTNTPTPSITPSETPTPTVTPTMTLTPSQTPPFPEPNIFTAFISTWSVDSTVELPYSPTGTYSGTIDWGDGNVVDNTYENRTHTYDTPGSYTIIILGEITGWNFGIYAIESANSLIELLDWGTLKGENNSNEYMFANCQNLTLSNVLTPINLNGVTSLKGMFTNCFSLTNIGEIESWDTSSITDMSEMFSNTLGFNGNISNWDVSNVTNMSNTFYNCESFNQDITNWDVSSVTDMSFMFAQADSFNQNIGSWDVSNVTNMSNMFANCILFNQNIGGWDVSNVTNMSNMFSLATNFNNSGNTSINNWVTSSCTDFSFMFENTSFNQPIGNWNVSSATTISGMFFENSSFNQDIGSWNVSNVTNASYLFYNASSFNQNLFYWDLTNVLDLTGVLDNCGLDQKNYDSFLIGISGILEQVPNTFESNLNVGVNGMVYSNDLCPGGGARNYLQNTFNWNFVGDTSGSCSQFISVWQLDSLQGNNSLNLPYSPTGKYSGVIDWGDGFYSLNSYENINHTYLGIGTYTITISGEIEGWDSYNYGTNNYNLVEVTQWGPLKGESNSNQNMFYGCANLSLSNVTDTPNLEGVISLDGMFDGCSNIYNVNNMNSWDVSDVQYMNGVFQNATNFNEDISSWNVSGVTEMEYMFNNATNFNQDLSTWCVSQIPSTPNNFDNNATSWVLPKPVWGTCP